MYCFDFFCRMDCLKILKYELSLFIASKGLDGSLVTSLNFQFVFLGLLFCTSKLPRRELIVVQEVANAKFVYVGGVMIVAQILSSHL